MRLTNTFLALLALLPASAFAGRTSLNDGWLFTLNDSAQSIVDLPHDWSVLQPFDRDAAPGNDGAYLPAGVGRYEKIISLAQVPTDGSRIMLYFEGVYERAKVYVNDFQVTMRPYGYSSFRVDVTPYIHVGDNNIKVVADNSNQKNCRWYSGSGIYRNVWLEQYPAVHIAPWGIGVSTPSADEAVFKIDVENASNNENTVIVSVDVDGHRASKTVRTEAGMPSTAEISVKVPGAKSWSPDSPKMYTAKVTVLDMNGRQLDKREQQFGFRTISWSADEGFKLNGKHVDINGACVHHDNGILGAAAYDGAEVRKAQLMKRAGFNAVRTSHNPPSEAFLNACDTIGLLVIDEAFDGWRSSKNSHDYHEFFDEWSARDAGDMVMRDRNHPSIIAWSIGNEIIERKSSEAVADAHRLAEVIRAIDATRPVTQALASWDSDWEIYDPLAAEHDIVGYNYMIHKAEGDHERVPARVMWQTESYPRDAYNNWKTVTDHSYIIGDFVWTGLDYLGESGIGRWYYEGDVEGEHYHRPLYPWHAAYCGDVDLTGLRKPISHYRSMLWNEEGEQLYVAVREPDGYRGKIKETLWGTWPTFENWNWPGHEGKPIEVEVYTRYPKARLWLGNVEIGTMVPDGLKATFTLDYEPGIITAEGLDENGKVMETKTLTTALPATRMGLTIEKPCADDDLTFVTIELLDSKGNVDAIADNLLTISTSEDIKLLALGNADIKDNDPYYDNSHRAWHGRALAVFRGKGDVKISAPDSRIEPIAIIIK